MYTDCNLPSQLANLLVAVCGGCMVVVIRGELSEHTQVLTR